jgi:hypothetical protein
MPIEWMIDGVLRPAGDEDGVAYSWWNAVDCSKASVTMGDVPWILFSLDSLEMATWILFLLDSFEIVATVENGRTLVHRVGVTGQTVNRADWYSGRHFIADHHVNVLILDSFVCEWDLRCIPGTTARICRIIWNLQITTSAIEPKKAF